MTTALPHAHESIHRTREEPPSLIRLVTVRAGSATVGVRDAEADVIRDHLSLARVLAARYRRRGVDSDDLEQVATVGLMKATRRWKPGRGRFVACATPTIHGELNRYFRDLGTGIRMPRALYEAEPAIVAGQRALRQREGREPSVAAIAQEVGVSRRRVRNVRAAMAACQPLSTDDAAAGAANVCDADAAAELAGLAGRADLYVAVHHLPPREQRALALRFVWGQSQREIAGALGVSQMEISRMLRRILDRLRAELDAVVSPVG